MHIYEYIYIYAKFDSSIPSSERVRQSEAQRSSVYRDTGFESDCERQIEAMLIPIKRFQRTPRLFRSARWFRKRYQKTSKLFPIKLGTSYCPPKITMANFDSYSGKVNFVGSGFDISWNTPKWLLYILNQRVIWQIGEDGSRKAEKESRTQPPVWLKYLDTQNWAHHPHK